MGLRADPWHPGESGKPTLAILRLSSLSELNHLAQRYGFDVDHVLEIGPGPPWGRFSVLWPAGRVMRYPTGRFPGSPSIEARQDSSGATWLLWEDSAGGDEKWTSTRDTI